MRQLPRCISLLLFRILSLGFGSDQNESALAKSSCDAMFLDISKWIIIFLAQSEVKAFLWTLVFLIHHTATSHTVPLGCLLCRIAYLDIFHSRPFYPPSQITSLLPSSTFSLPSLLCSPQEPCYVPCSPWRTHLQITSPSHTLTWTPKTRLAHLDISLWSGIFSSIFLRMSHMFVTEDRKVFREERREGRMQKRKRGSGKGSKSLFLV